MQIALLFLLALVSTCVRGEDAGAKDNATSNEPRLPAKYQDNPAEISERGLTGDVSLFESTARSEYDATEVIGKTPAQLLKLRGFGNEVHYVRTKDGYYIHVIRIINPELPGGPIKRPVVFNHGLLESSTIWLINSLNVFPLAREDQCSYIVPTGGLNETQFLNGPMLLANNGYDVWLMSMRGTDWSLRHEHFNARDPEFWDYSLDDFALVDVPSVVDFVRRETGSRRVAYIGHSQATFSVFGLLSMRPSYAQVIQPVVAVAPVAYFDHITSVARLLFEGTLTATNKDQHGPFPENARAMRKLFATVCQTADPGVNALACRFIEMLISGKGKASWLRGYFSHLPFYTSLKVLRHFAILIREKRYCMYDYGTLENERLYGSEKAPSYPIDRIKSKSIVLVRTGSDALSPVEDVLRFKKSLSVPVFRDILIEKDFDHFDLITDREAMELVWRPVFDILEQFERKTGVCKQGVADRKPSVSLPALKQRHKQELIRGAISGSDEAPAELASNNNNNLVVED